MDHPRPEGRRRRACHHHEGWRRVYGEGECRGRDGSKADNVAISTVGDLYLPAEAVANAEIVDGEDAIEAVKAETGENENSVETAYQVFDISLENVRSSEYEGFQVEFQLPESVIGKEFHLYHVHDGQVEELEFIKDSVAVDGETELVRTLSFVTPNFSEFVLSYTVDFEYEGKQWSWPGEGSYSVASIMAELDIFDEIESVKLLKTDDVGGEENALYLEEKEDGWYLTSDVSFKDTYELSVKAGEKIYVITVTDVSYSMQDAVSSVSADGLSGSTWTVKEGEEYTIHISFEETPSVVQFPTTGNTLEYQLPNNFQPTGSLTNVPVTLTYTEASVTHTLTGCTYSVDANGKVTITLTDEAKEKLAESGDGKFNINITGMFTESNEHTDFGGGNVKDITVDQTRDVTINKTGQYNSSDNKVHYTVTVKADGSLTNVHVQDVISGTALTMDQGSLTYSGNSSTPTGGPTSDGFNLTFPTMKNGETITINYTASVDWSEIGEGKGTVEQTGNSVKVKPDGIDEKQIENNLNNQISYNPLGKNSGTVQDTFDPDVKIVPWTITLNAQGLKNMKNTTITDHNNSSDVMKYAGTGITIEKFQVNSDGTTTSLGTTSVSWEDLEIDPDTATSWSYKITDDGNYKYVITYNTEVDVSGKNGNTQVSNYVDDNNHNSAGGGSSVPPGSSKIDVDKVFGTADKDQMTWTVTLHVPATGLSKAILIDTLPSSGSYQDTLNVDSLNVQGLESTDSYVLTQSKGKFTLTFYKDEEHSVTGLNGTGRERDITVTFTTDNDPEWVANNRNENHTNNVSFQGDNSTVYDHDSGSIPLTGLEKNSNGYKTVTIDGEQKIVFEYTIDLYGIADSDFEDGGLVITDDYDQTYLKFLDLSSASSIDGLDVYWAQQFRYSYGGERGASKVVPADDGDKLTFTIQKSDLPLNNGELFSAYQLKYYMVAKDSTALLNASLAKSDHIISIDNKAKWGESEDEVTVDYGYPGLVKTNIASSTATDPNTLYNSEDGTTGFKIVINPDKLELNNGQTMVLKDVFSGNLSVDYSSINIDVEPADDVIGTQTVTYDYKGNVGTYYIPDKCKVTITYNARVIGNPGEWVSYDNTATMSGYSDSSSGRAWMGGSGDGGFNIYSVKLFKYSAGHMETPLEGATFTLVDENNNPVVYPSASTHDVGQPITFTTGADGYVNISLNEQEDGISLQKGITYYLKETVSPATHAINNTTYRFTISDNPNYANYEYHSGDILKVYDWPIQGRIVIEKEIEGASNLTEEDKKKITFEITGTYADGSTIKLDSWGYAIEYADLMSKYTATERAALKDFKIKISYADFTNGKYTMADLVDGTYSVEETNAAIGSYESVNTVSTTYEVDTNGNRVDSDGNGTTDNDVVSGTTEATVTISEHSKYVVNYTNTYSDKPHHFDLTIKKVHKDGTTETTLYGAVFKLEKGTQSGHGPEATYTYSPVTTGSVGTDGTFTIGYDNKDSGVILSSLQPGRYRITEIQAPTNYSIIGDGVIEFQIYPDHVDIISGQNFVTYTNTTPAGQHGPGSERSGTLTVNNNEKHSYTVTKVDGANVSLKLPDAVFGVWASHYPATTDVTTAMDEDKAEPSNPLWTYTTDANGKFEIQMSDHDYQQNTIYYFKEITAPTGYELPDNPTLNYFYFSYPTTAPTAMKPANLGDSNRSQTITNDLEPLEVKKLWKNLKGDNLNKQDIDVDEIEFVVYQTVTEKKADGTVVSTSAEKRFPDSNTNYTIEYRSGQWTTVTVPNAPSLGKNEAGNFLYYTYRVEEVVPDGWEASVVLSNNGREATITNTPEPIDITVKKAWDVPASMDPNQADAKAYFEVYQKNDSGTWVKIPINGKNENELNKGNSWEMSFQVEAGSEYKIVETRSAPNHWPITSFDTTIVFNNGSTPGRELEFSEAGIIEITNTYNVPYLEVRKIWETEDDTSVLYPHVKIYRREIGTETWEVWQSDVTLEPGNNWAKTYTTESNPALDTDKNYEYYVEEISVVQGNSWQALNPNPFTVTYSASADDPVQKTGTMTVTNTKYDGEISVQKNWVYADGTTAGKSDDTARVILQRALAEKDGFLVTLVVNNINYNNGVDTQTNSVVVTEHDTVTFSINEFWGANTGITTDSGVVISQINNGSGSITLPNITSDMTVTVTLSNDNGGCNKGKVFLTSTHSVNLNVSGTYQDVPGTAVTLNSGNNWSHTWDNLPLDAGNNQEYVYSVREIQVNGKSLAAAGFTSSVTGGDVQNGNVTVTNTEIVKGALKLTKAVTVGRVDANGSTRADGTYTFRVTDSSNGRHIVAITIVKGTPASAKVDGTDVTLLDGYVVLEGLPEGSATVQEINSTNAAVTMDLSEHTVAIVGGTTAQSANVAAITITNTYDATGSVPLKAKKIYEDHTLEGEEFTFTLTEYTADDYETIKTEGVSQEKKNDANGDVLFDEIEYAVADAGIDEEHPITYYYVIKETKGTNPKISYDQTEYKVTVSVYDKGDGMLSVTKTVTPSDELPAGYDAVFTNKEDHGGSLEITKVVTAGSNAEGKTFTFDVVFTNSDDTPYMGKATVTDSTRPTATEVQADSEGKITVTVDGIGTAKLEALPSGTKYAITEQSLDGWKQVGEIVYNEGADKILSSNEKETATITNTELTDFEFDKIWLGTAANLSSFSSSDYQTWPTDASITVEITRLKGAQADPDFKLTYVLNSTAQTFEPTDTALTPEEKTLYILTRTSGNDHFTLGKVLDPVYTEGAETKQFTYVVTETSKPDNYGTVHYGAKDGGSWTYKETLNGSGARDEGVIINQETGGYVLPQTGGIGTALFTTLGAILTSTAGAALVLKKRKERKTEDEA